MSTPRKIGSLPGIKRDGTRLEGGNYLDAKWCRFQRGLPRKMGGYKSVTDAIPEITRGITSFAKDSLIYIHLAGETTLNQYHLTCNATISASHVRTPAALVSSPEIIWQFDHFYDSVGATTKLVAHAGLNHEIGNSTNTAIFIGDVDAAGVLVDSTLPQVSGGIVALGPYLMSFGNSGRIGWSAVNNPTSLASEAFVTPQKIIRGLPLRGSSAGPAGLFWSLDSLIRANWEGGTTVWNFDTLVSDITVLSSQSIIEYDGVYYWPGVDRFLMFNGVVREVPNDMNINWFFDNLNFEQRQKVFAYKVPRFGEIWWCYPRGTATECTHAIIYNVRENVWYDTILPGCGRSAGLYAKVYNRPFMTCVDPANPTYSLWQHETGSDQIKDADVQPIPSYFETNEISMLEQQQATDQALRISRVEPDFIQTGEMTLTISGRINSRAPVVTSAPIPFPEIPTDGDEETVKLKEARRLMSFKFESNAIGGDYQFGDTYAHLETVEARIES